MPSYLRVAFALLAFVAVAWQLKLHVDASFDVVNFFSYFTNLSNLLAATMLLVSASKVRRQTWVDPMRGIAVVAIAVVGLVFGALLRDVDLGALLPWINAVLHIVMPSVVVVDWLLDPPRARLGTKPLAIALAYPTLYLVYVLVRGAATGWYPYPFLNPARVGGYGGVAAYAIGIAVAFALTAWALFAIGNRLQARRRGRHAAAEAADDIVSSAHDGPALG